MWGGGGGGLGPYHSIPWEGWNSKHPAVFYPMQVCLVRLKQSNDLHLSAAHYLRRYREEHGENFELDISENNLSCLVKLHRALYFPM